MIRTAFPMLPLRKAAAVSAAILLLLFAAAGVARSQGEGSSGDAADFVRRFGDQAVAVLADESRSAGDLEQAFRRLLTSRFDVDTIGRFVLGRHWPRATDHQRSEYRRLFEEFVIDTYGRRLRGYSGEQLQVGIARNHGPRGTTVSSQVIRPEAPPVRVDWHLRPHADGWLIIDIIVEGVSMALTQRAEFDSVIRSRGGRVEGLLERLRELTAA